jgi:hypothetical protein
VRNEENEYLVPDPNRTMVTTNNEFSDVHKKSLKEELFYEISEKLMEKLQDMVKQKVQDEFNKYQYTTKNEKRHRNN